MFFRCDKSFYFSSFCHKLQKYDKQFPGILLPELTTALHLTVMFSLACSHLNNVFKNILPRTRRHGRYWSSLIHCTHTINYNYNLYFPHFSFFLLLWCFSHSASPVSLCRPVQLPLLFGSVKGGRLQATTNLLLFSPTHQHPFSFLLQLQKLSLPAATPNSPETLPRTWTSCFAPLDH